MQLEIHDRSFTSFIRTTPGAQTASNDSNLNCFYLWQLTGLQARDSPAQQRFFRLQQEKLQQLFGGYFHLQ